MKTCATCHQEFASGEVFCPNDGARLRGPSIEAETRARDPLVGSVLQDRYRILRRVGEGGMGFVYEAEHELIEKRVALKVLRADLSSRSDLVERFRQEAKSASRIGHAHIVDISDFGWTPEGAAYFVMEMLQGEDLADLLGRERRVEPSRAVDIAIQCCKALGAAHAKGILHRDMKPENIFLTKTEDQRDFVKLVDFGIAKMTDFDRSGDGGRKLTKTGVLFGTPEYMAPEQAAGKGFDHRADLYALGVILYEMLTGKVPFEGDNFLHVLAQHSHDPVPPLHERHPDLRISAALEQAIVGALEKDPERRFQDMNAFARALSGTPEAGEGWSEASSPSVARPSPASLSSARGLRGRRALIAATAAGAAVIVGVTLAWVGLAGREESGDDGTPAQPTDSQASVAAASPTAEPISPEPEEAEEPAKPVDLEAASMAETPAEVAEAEEPANETVVVRVVTQPAGAQVRIEGRGMVCEHSPCEVQVPRGKEVALAARRGRGRATTRFVAEEEREVALRLRGPAPARRSGNRGTSRNKPASSGSSDLKVPDIFRK